jgi:hypothetical protein
VLSGAAKNPRLLKACNITRTRDMGEFFFISMSDEIVVDIFTTQRNTILGTRGIKNQILPKIYPGR